MTFWLIVLAVAITLFAIAWWTSGRDKRKLGRATPGAESARGHAMHQALIHQDGIGGAGGGGSPM